MSDQAFSPDSLGLSHALSLLTKYWDSPPLGSHDTIQENNMKIMLEKGLGELVTLEFLAPKVIGEARQLYSQMSFAHMDPPTPWITWALDMWKSALNQNLLHPEVAPIASQIEALLIGELAAYFGQSGGHFTSGSSLSNLSALWAARELTKSRVIITSDVAHVSIAKSANILGLELRILDSDLDGKIQIKNPSDASNTILVLTAGTTSTGAVDSLLVAGNPAWVHVDAAWAGPLRLTKHYSHLLDGIERADSISISAHKWLFQPKESAFVLFKNADRAHQAISMSGAYLSSPNIGVAGSRSAAAVTLAATFMAMGLDGLSSRIVRCIEQTKIFAEKLVADGRFEILRRPDTGVLLWRPKSIPTMQFKNRLAATFVSTTQWKGELWIRSVAANPNVNACAIYSQVVTLMDQL